MKDSLVRVGVLTVALAAGLQVRVATAQPTLAEHRNNLKQIGLAFHLFHADFNRLPASATFNQDGKALLSWRVALLPYLDQNALYKQFKLDEPWDSPNNIKLLDKMPALYGPAGANDDASKTLYRVFTGPGTVFDGKQGLKLTSVLDGTSNTIMVVQALEPVPWTKPDELPYSDKEPLPKFSKGNQGFAVLLCDGAVLTFRTDFDVQQMRYAILRADGNTVDFTKLERYGGDDLRVRLPLPELPVK